ncbi:hypothetical protein KF707_21290 [Candidatus Obscuribacterales bacterium]|nr:hypothetical protein [Candidatus Obscuribacterales bacterium]MBX3138778.1 hypothetical protein [Candidatus Obscuribacterales bacterium]
MAKSDATNRKNVKDKNEENSMTDEECAIRATEKGFGKVGAHRCDEHGDVGPEGEKSGKWIEKQNIEEMGPNRPAGKSYRTLEDGKSGKPIVEKDD